MDTQQFADEINRSIQYTIQAHAHHPKQPEDAVRYWDHFTPYAVHPIWCAMTLLTETALPDDVRRTGYQALLWHDLLEDTGLPLPAETSPAVRQLVEEMTFAGFSEEKEKLWERSDLARLLKLYDKVSNLLDGSWMSGGKKWQDYVAHTLRLVDFVSARYGALNIVKIARVIAVPLPGTGESEKPA